MLAQPKVLVVDDNPSCQLTIGLSLTSAGYRVIKAFDGLGVVDIVRSEVPALVILDVQMPNRGGWETLADLRRNGCAVPVLMLTECGEVQHRIRGLRDGADDYVAKGCDLDELRARVHALLRRSGALSNEPKLLRIGGVTVDLERKTAHREGESVALTRKEYLLLELFARNLGKPVSRELMLDQVWGYDHLPDTRTIDTHLWRLRKKISGASVSESWLRNLPGIGYVMTGELDGQPDPAGDLLSLAAG